MQPIKAQAKEKGLIDRTGGLLAAIDEAKERAGIPEEQRVILDIYPKRKSFVHLPARPALGLLDILFSKVLRDWLILSQEPGALAIMPYHIKIF